MSLYPYTVMKHVFVYLIIIDVRAYRCTYITLGIKDHVYTGLG